MLNAFAVIHWLLTVLQRHVRFFPRWFAPFKAATARHLSHKVDGVYVVHFDLKYRFDGGLNFGFRGVAIDPESQQLARVL